MKNNKKLFISIGINLIGLMAMPILNNYLIVFLINLMIIQTYIINLPKNIFNPKNIVFAFSFLYVVLPSFIEMIYFTYNIGYILPWGQSTYWFTYSLSTYYDILLLYLLLFYSFHFFTPKEETPQLVKYKIDKKKLIFLIVITIVSLFVYMNATGGVSIWINNYKEAFLLGRGGNGILNFITLFLVNISVFILSLYYTKEKKLLIYILSILLIVLAAYIQGLKSRIIILLIIFYFPYLLQIKLKISKIAILGVLFFALLYIGNYIRSNGFYSGVGVFFEYMMTYFNVYEIHNMVKIESSSDFFKTVHYMFTKPLIYMGFLNDTSPYDLSVELTKVYFPNDWESMNATQQWPLVTNLYYNYYGFFLGWIPIVIYAFAVSSLYKELLKGNYAVSLIFILEYFRIFSVQRGEFIPWQMPIYIALYIIIYLVVNQIIYINMKTYNISSNR